MESFISAYIGVEELETAEYLISKRCRYKGSWNSFQIEIKISSFINLI
jgi:hypothetical protein